MTPQAVIAISPGGERTTYPSIAKCCSVHGFAYTAVKNCAHGRQASHKGFTFELVDQSLKRPPRQAIVDVAELRNQGVNNHRIAKRLGLKLSTVTYYASQAVSLGLCQTYHHTRGNQRVALRWL